MSFPVETDKYNSCPIIDSKGSFQLRSKEETDRIRQAKEEQQARRQIQAAQWLGGSILDRHAQDAQTSRENINAAVNASYSLDLMPVKDSGMSSTSPPSFSVPVIQVNSDEVPGTSQSVNGSTPISSSTLFVPDRVAAEYKDDQDDYAQIKSPSPLTVPSISVSAEKAEVIILLSKKRTSLGRFSYLFLENAQRNFFV